MGAGQGREEYHFSREISERGQKRRRQSRGQADGNDALQDRFPEKLPNKPGAFGADDFPDADFPSPEAGSGRGQIDEINAGDQEDENSDDGEDGDISGASVRFKLADEEMRVKMDLGQGLKEVLPVLE